VEADAGMVQLWHSVEGGAPSFAITDDGDMVAHGGNVVRNMTR
jgi:hypothetical protein